MSALIDVSYAQKVSRLAALDTTSLQQMIEDASGVVEDYCNRSFLKADYIEVLSGDGHPDILVNETPIVELDATEAVKILYVSADDETYDSDYFRYDAQAGIVRFKSYYYFPEGFQNVQVKYTAGYELGDMPSSIKLAVRGLMLHWLSGWEADPTVQSESLGQYSITRRAITDEIPALITRYLKHYRRFRI